MPQHLSVTALAGLCLSGTVVAKSWLCVGELSTGFAFKNQRHEIARFDASAFKMVIREPTEADKPYIDMMEHKGPVKFLAVELGEKIPTMLCWLGIDQELVQCDVGFQELIFEPVSLRFQHYYIPGYVYAHPESPDGQKIQKENTPSLTIGKCTAIS